MANLLNIGVSGLVAHQSAIETTGHNITNANVEGYSRQEAVLSTRPPQFTGAGFEGSGVVTSDIRRISDQFLTNQLQTDTSTFADKDAIVGELSQLDSLLADEQAGLSAGLQNFFSALQAGSDDPASVAARQLVLSEAENLASRFNTLHARVDNQRVNINNQLTAGVEQVNRLAGSIAELNSKISALPGAGQDNQPNDLLDQREALIKDLAELVAVKTSTQDGKTVNVFIGNGQSLVQGGRAGSIQTVASNTVPGQLEIAIGDAIVSNNINGGTIGGLMAASREVVQPTLNTLGRIALGVAQSMNQQQSLGVDLEGRGGANIFFELNATGVQRSRVIADANNAVHGNTAIGVAIDNVSKLGSDDFVLSFNGPASNDFILTRASDSSLVASGSVSSSLPASLVTEEGFTLNFDSNNFQVGDRFLLQPTRNAAADINVAMQRPEELAFAQPIRTDSALGNIGSGIVSPGVVQAVKAADGSPLASLATIGELSPPLLVRFSSDTQFDVLDNSDPANPVDLVPPRNNLIYTAGSDGAIFPADPADPAYTGFQVSISGLPAAGDEFTIDFNGGGQGDNRNALAMLNLQSAGSLEGGNKSFSQTYGQMLAGVG
ncbi:MAG: flagellar hook-associated protein FlgK, partial [Pseudomonadales bacterium]